MKAFIVDSTHKTLDSKTYIQIFGRLDNGQSFLSMSEFTPYFFIEESDLKKLSPILTKFKTEKTNLTTFQNKKVIKISSDNQSDMSKLVTAIHKKKINTYEADIKPHIRFLIDNDILGPIDITGEYISSEKVDRLYHNPTIKSISKKDFKPSLKVLSIDIETDKKFNNLYCIGLYSKDYKKNFIISKQKIPDAISCKDELEVLTKFKEEIAKIDPDIITGWNVIEFDLNFLKKKFAEHKIAFDIGRTNENASIRITSGFFRASSASVPGRQVLDGLSLVKDPFIKEAPSIKHAKFDSYTLEDVSQSILGDGKLLKGSGRHNEITTLYETERHDELCKYNLQDCKLVYDILKKTNMIDLAIERSTLTGMPLDRITASIAAFDSLYIREARKRGLVSPTTVFSNTEERLKGGYVMESTPGIFHNVLVLDFKSLYPSIIKTFNIDPASYLEKKEKDSIESPNNAYFKNQDGILPEIIERLHQEREKAKKEKRELSSYAIKIIMNSFWGVLASPNCRYFNFKMASAITGFARFIIQLTAKKIEEMGYKVIYSDTDSVFVDTDLGKEKANKLGEEIQSYINKFYDDYVKKNYNRKSYLELEFEKQYLAFLMPPLRQKTGEEEKGSKKRYAGLLEKSGKEHLEIVGLEAIRGDWTEAAKEFQRELLNKLFHKEEFIQFIKDYVKNLRDGKMDENLVYKKSIRKNLAQYTKTTPPHVKAARKLDKLESNIIKYYMTTEGPEPIQKHIHKIDYDHYIEKQIKPIANTILFFFHKKFDDIIANSTQ
ncbi:hypothetical protein COU60_01870, partial [Candidatus Pacearchaeota archaeon CG10_big_fil_rev_8_21_14_0_10_34_76]